MNKHRLIGKTENRQVWLDGVELKPYRSQKYINHSDGFNWGYGGSGPAQLALAIILELTGKPDGYQDFKRDVIARLPLGQDFDIVFSAVMDKWEFNAVVDKSEDEMTNLPLKKVNKILIELTNVIGFNHSDEHLKAYDKAFNEIISVLSEVKKEAKANGK